MRIFDKRTFRRAAAFRMPLAILTVAVFFMLAGPLLASSGSEHTGQAAGQHEAAGETVGEHGSEGGSGHGAGWVATDWYRVMNFAALFIGLFIILRKPVAQTFSDRIKGIRRQLEELEEQKKAAEEDLSRYNNELAKLDQEAEKIVKEYIRQGNEARDRILKAAEASAQKIEEQAQRNIESEFKRAKEQMVQAVMEKALVKAEQRIKSSITPDDQNKLVDEYLEKVVA